MRKNYKKQMPLTITSIDHPHAEELASISQILDDNPIIYEWVLQDLARNPRYDIDLSGLVDCIISVQKKAV